jgi:transcription termination/antitermination protein NusA
MLDIKTFRSALEQLEEERKIPKEKILDAIEQAMAAAYKKDYGKKGQIIRAKFDLETGKTEFFQIKIVVDESIVKTEEISDQEEYSVRKEGDERVHFNPEHHIMIEDAKKIKKNVVLNDEIIFSLEAKDDYGRIAAQTAKQVIVQRIREAERTSIIDEYGTKEGEIISGIVQKIERGNVYIDFNRATGILPAEEQIPGEYLQRGQRIRAYLYAVEDTPRGINLRLSRTHPKFIEKLFSIEAPEIENGIVEIKSIAREAGARSKIAVNSNDKHIDPVGSCVGQKGTRVNTITNELGGEKIDIIPWSEDPKVFISNSLSPAKVISIEVNEREHKAIIEVSDDQLSLAIGKGGQNVRLAAKLTGWRIDIKGNGSEVTSTDGEKIEIKEEEKEEEKKEEKEVKKTKKKIKK